MIPSRRDTSGGGDYDGQGTFCERYVVRYRNPHLSGILFDLPTGIAAAKAGIGGDLPRTEFVAGDFFEAVPPNADVYVVKKVIHD
jgi:hypothetical protein